MLKGISRGLRGALGAGSGQLRDKASTAAVAEQARAAHARCDREDGQGGRGGSAGAVPWRCRELQSKPGQLGQELTRW